MRYILEWFILIGWLIATENAIGIAEAMYEGLYYRPASRVQFKSLGGGGGPIVVSSAI